MGYVIAAYGVTVIALAAYGVQLVRERSRLARDARAPLDAERSRGDRAAAR